MEDLNKTTAVLKQGGIVIFPTDTAYGIGCRVDCKEAVKRLFSIRKRSEEKAVPVLVKNLQMAKKYWTTPLPNIVRRLTKQYWPGGLTIIYKANITTTPLLVRGGTDLIGLRMPNHPVPLKLIDELKVGLIGTSANYSGYNTPYSFDVLDKKLVSQVDYVVRGECGLKASTVVDCTKRSVDVVRKGAVDVKY